VTKQLVNSVLFSEGRRYVSYDKKSFTYTISTEASDIPAAITSTSASKASAASPTVQANLLPTIADKPAASEIRNSGLFQVRVRLPRVDYIVRCADIPSPVLFDIDPRGDATYIIL